MVDPDLQIRGGGPGHPDPEIGGGGRSPKKFFLALRASVWPKNRGGERAPRAPTLDLPLLLASLQLKIDHVTTYFGPTSELQANLSHEINFLHAHSHLDYLRWRQQFSSPEPVV